MRGIYRLMSDVAEFGRKHRSFGKIIFSMHNIYVRSHVWSVTQYQNIKYDAPIDPYQLYWIDPNEIKYTLVNDFWWQASSVVKNGDWDKKISYLSGKVRTQSLKKHYVENVPWEDTKYFNHLLIQISKKGQTRFGSNRKELLESLKEYDDLYLSIKKDGYKTQRELRDQKNPSRGQQRRHLPPELLEVATAIARDGEWIHDDGGHRLIIAQILGLEEIPVRVIARHKQWQKVRNEVVKSETKKSQKRIAEKHSQHEDIQSLLSSK